MEALRRGSGATASPSLTTLVKKGAEEQIEEGEEQDDAGAISPRSKFHCDSHSEVQPFMLKELRTQVFDTYAICAALLTTMSSSRFFFDNRDPTEFLTGRGMHTTMHLSFLLQHVHLLLASICTAGGMESMMVFTLTAMYSRSALALPSVGAKVFDFFLAETGKQRINAFGFMLFSGVLSSLNLIVNCLAMPTFVLNTQAPAIILDVVSVATACIVLGIALFTVAEVYKLVGAAKIIFSSERRGEDTKDEERTPLLEEGNDALVAKS